MTRYRYSDLRSPPAPFVNLELTNEETGARLAPVPAQLDTAADRTILPGSVKETLGLATLKTIKVAGLGEEVRRIPLHRVLLSIQPGVPAKPIEVAVASVDGEPFVILGRDVLNQFRIVLGGPAGKLDIEG